MICYVVSSCEDMTLPEAKKIQDLVNDNSGRTPEYYENLRAYKKTKHQIAFGWFGFWNGGTTSNRGSLNSLPDSMDIVSTWGSVWSNLTQRQQDDLRQIQQLKGTRVAFTVILTNVGDKCTPIEHASSYEDQCKYWGYEKGNDQAIKLACEKYANALCDTLFKYNYDGFDMDFEPSYGYAGNLAMKHTVDPKPMTWFVEALSKRIGPKSDSGKLLLIDGETWASPPHLAPYYDYIIEQAYTARNLAALESRYQRYIKHYGAYRDQDDLTSIYILTENFESYWKEGGVVYTDENKKTMPSSLGMAIWQPKDPKILKGGAGTYHMEYEYVHNPDYKYMQQMIQLMNPAAVPAF